MQSRVAIPSAMAGWLLVTSAASGGGAGVGTAFTYQGLLSQSGTEVTDACDFEFRAFDAATNGVQVGPTLTFDGVGANPQPPDVVDGLFTVDLDFGAGVFDGNPRFLEIAVRCPSGAGSYTTLEPRQPISPAPYAIRATQADSAANLVVPLVLSLDDSGQTTLTVENAASGGEALEVLGNLRVGPLGQFQVDSASGNVAAQGTVTADNLEATSDFAPMVRFFNFNGAAVAVQIIGDTEFQGSVGLDVSDPQHPIDHSSGAHLSDAGVFNNASSRRLKEDFQSINNREVLDRLHDLPITRWKYKTDSPQVAHLGPTAEDFREAFGLGTGDETIGTVDADGVALAAIQGLYDIVKQKETEISALNERLARLEAALAGQVRTDDK